MDRTQQLLSVREFQSITKMKRTDLSNYYDFQKILLICTNGVRNWKAFDSSPKRWHEASPIEIDLRKTKMFIHELSMRGAHLNESIPQLVKPLLDENWEFRWLWWFLDRENKGIRDYANRIIIRSGNRV